MTLLALTLCVGFVVDDAIVMLENIVRHIEGGMRPFEAALKGSREIGFTIVSITLSLIAVFIPVLLMGGIVGRVFREFAMTISIAIIISGFVSLTLTPMLCARMLRGHDPHDTEKKPFFLLRWFESMFNGWLRGYEWTLDKAIKYKPVTLLITIATVVGTIWLYYIYPKGLFPTEDTGFMLVVTEAATDTSFEAMVMRQAKIAEIIKADKAVDYVNSTVGASGPNSTANCGRMFVVLKPKNERDADAGRDRAPDARDRRACRASRSFPRPIQNINIGGRISKSEYQYTLQSSDTEPLYKIAPELERTVRAIARTARRHDRPLHQEPADAGRYRPREGGGLRHHASIRSGRNCSTPTARARFRRSTRRRTTTRSSWRRFRNSRKTRPICRSFGSRPRAGRPSRSSAVREARADRRPAAGQPPGPAALGDDLYNVAPGFSIGQANEAIKRVESEANLPATIVSELAGRHAGVRGREEGAGPADPRRGVRGLCRARHPV